MIYSDALVWESLYSKNPSSTSEALVILPVSAFDSWRMWWHNRLLKTWCKEIHGKNQRLLDNLASLMLQCG